MDWLQVLYFFFSLRLALREKCRVCLAWLIKGLLCRLPWNGRAQQGRNTTQLYMQLDTTIDDVTTLPNSDVIDCGAQIPPSPSPFNACHAGYTTSSGYKGQNVCSFSLKNFYCWSFILCEKVFTVGTPRPILLMQILYNAVKRLTFFKCDELSKSTAFTFKILLIFLEYIFEVLINTAPLASNSVYEQNFTAKSLKYYNPPHLFVVILFCLFFFFNHIVFTYWLVSICLPSSLLPMYAFARSNVFLVVTIIRLSNKNDVILHVGYFTVF